MKGRIPKDVEEVYEKSVKQSLLSMPKCTPMFASKLAEKAAPDLRDPRTGIRYVEEVAKGLPEITVTKVDRFVLVHKDSPNEVLNQECLQRCAEPVIKVFGTLFNEDLLETMIGKLCVCRCQNPLDRSPKR